MSTAQQPDRDDFDELVEANAQDEFGEAWVPKKDETQPRTLVGWVRGYNLAKPDMNKWPKGPPWVCNVQDRDGKAWSVFLLGKVLFEEFARTEPGIGDEIVVRYCGTAAKASQPGWSPAEIFRVTTRKSLEAPKLFARPELAAAATTDDAADVPIDAAGLPPAPAADVDVPDADVVEDRSGDAGGDDDDLPEIPFLWDGPPDWREPRIRGCVR
jgi:hypothetical protein